MPEVVQPHTLEPCPVQRFPETSPQRGLLDCPAPVVDEYEVVGSVKWGRCESLSSGGMTWSLIGTDRTLPDFGTLKSPRTQARRT